MTLAQLGAQLPPAILRETLVAYKAKANEILDQKIAKCDEKIAGPRRLFSDAETVSDDQTVSDVSGDKTAPSGNAASGDDKAGPSGYPPTPPVKKEEVSDNPPSSGNNQQADHRSQPCGWRGGCPLEGIPCASQ